MILSRLGPRTRAVVLLLGLLIPQFILIGPSLIGKQVLLPLTLLSNVGWPAPEGVRVDHLQDNTLLSDLNEVMEMNRVYAVRELRAGRLPLWNPYSYCGAPFLASNLPAVFSPLRVIDYAWPGPWALAWDRVLCVIVAGVGMYLLLRDALRLRIWPAMFGAWCYPLTGFFVQWSGFTVLSVVVWTPLLIWATDRAINAHGRRVRYAIAMALLTACVLVSGHSAAAAHVLLLDGFYAVFALHRRFGWRALASGRGIAAALIVVVAWLLGIGLSMPQTWPTLDYMKSSSRIAARRSGHIEGAGEGLSSLPQFVVPWFHGSWQTGYLIPGNTIEGGPSGYAGLILLCSAAPFAWLSRRRRGLLLFWAIAGVLGAAEVLHIPLLSSVFHLPGLNTLRNNRLTFVTGMAIVIWASVGLNELFAHARRSWWVMLVAAVPLAIGAVCLYRYWNQPETVRQAFLVMDNEVRQSRSVDPHLATRFLESMLGVYANGALFSAIAIIALFVAMILRRRRKMIVCAIVLLAIIELLSNAWDVSPQSDPRLYFPKLPVLEEIAHRARGRVCGMDCLPAPLLMYERLPDVRGYDSADPDRIVQLLSAIRDPRAQSLDYAQVQWFYPVNDTAVLDLLDLRYLVFPASASNPEVRYRDANHALVERPTAQRIYIPSSVERIDDSKARIDRLTSPEWNPHKSVVLETDAPSDIRAGRGKASIVSDSPSRVVIEAGMQSPGVLTLSDCWDAGWHASVNGVPARVFHANHAFRALSLPAGKSTIEFTYWPDGFSRGCWIALISAVALLGWIVGSMLFARRVPHRRYLSRAFFALSSCDIF